MRKRNLSSLTSFLSENALPFHNGTQAKIQLGTRVTKMGQGVKALSSKPEKQVQASGTFMVEG